MSEAHTVRPDITMTRCPPSATRRRLLQSLAGASVVGVWPPIARAEAPVTRVIPSTGEGVPVIGVEELFRRAGAERWDEVRARYDAD